MSNFCQEKSKFFVKLSEKIKISRKFAWKIDFLYPDPRPQISSKINAAASHNIDCSEALSARKPRGTRNVLTDRQDVRRLAEMPEMPIARSMGLKPFQVALAYTEFGQWDE